MSNPGRETRGSLSPSPSPSFTTPSPSPALSPDPEHNDDSSEHPGARAAPSPWFNRLTFSLGFPSLPSSPAVPATSTSNTTQTISLYFDADFVPQDVTLHAVFGSQGFVSCTLIPPAIYASLPITPYTAIDSNTVVNFARPPRRGSGSVRAASLFCFALFLIVYTVAVCILLLAAVGRSGGPSEPPPVLSSPIPLQENVTNILRLYDEALVPIAASDDDNDFPDTQSLDLIDLLHKEISNFCLLISEQAPDIEAVEYMNRVCGWAHEATGDLRHAWLLASRFRSGSMSITRFHWLQNLASALRSEQSYEDTSDSTNTSRRILSTVSQFLDPNIEQGLLPRSLRKGYSIVEAVLTHLENMQEEVDRLVTLADEHNIQPDADAQPPLQLKKSAWTWPLLSRNAEPVFINVNWTAAAIKGDKVLLAVHASRALARVVRAGGDAVAFMKPKATKAGSRLRQAGEALNDTSYTLGVLLETLGSDVAPSMASSKFPLAWNRAVDGMMHWASLLKVGAPRKDWWQLGTPWLTCGSGHGGTGPARTRDERERECGCAACWILWYVPVVDDLVELSQT
ncbi:hypothetical protein GQ607_016941 [Colletotrichum asianum]|uniref:Uncharacterized protein n=1 Tax=Colletotrichum asianum TaxID=702518 RepID=A0A8H3VXP6_9PEZI|nr:hypothetical protein GQ607_016941 [Colletotrichum asianum]